MKKNCFLLFFLCICTSFIHSAKQETNQSSTQDTLKTNEKKRYTRRRKRSRRYYEELARQEEMELAQRNLAQNQFQQDQIINPIIIGNRKEEEEKKLNLFFTNIEFTHTGIASFFNHTFNRKEYGSDFLPHNFSHLTQFLQYAQHAGQSKEFTEGVLRLFNQKLKMSSYVSAPALERMLLQASPYLEHQLAQQEFSLWSEIKNTLINTFRTRFSFLQENPFGFFDDVSKELSDKVTLQVTTPDRVRFTLLRMLTSSCDKLVWSPHDQIDTWRSFKAIGNSIEQLHQKKVIPDELDANDLYWSLVERYTYFMELVGSRLNLETCQTIKKDIQEHKVAWLEIPEQETGLQTKIERLAQTLIETEAKIRAGKMGLLTDTIRI